MSSDFLSTDIMSATRLLLHVSTTSAILLVLSSFNAVALIIMLGPNNTAGVHKADTDVHRPESTGTLHASALEDLYQRWDRLYDMTPGAAQKVTVMQVFALFPITYDCDKERRSRIGGPGDGGKWLCTEFLPLKGGQQRPAGEECVLFSLGSNGDFSYEVEMVRLMEDHCVMHTFDCTGSWTPPHPRIHFHPWCLDSSDHITPDGRQYFSWGTIVQKLNVKNIAILEIDIEHYEFPVLPAMLGYDHTTRTFSRDQPLPKQMTLEVHLTGNVPPGTIPEITQKQTRLHHSIGLIRLVYQAGYEITSYEKNDMCPKCMKFTFIHTGRMT